MNNSEENEEVDILKKTINERKKLPEKEKNNISDNVFFNVIFFIIMLVIAIYSNYLFNAATLTLYNNIMKVIQIGVCIISLVLIEVAFRKNSREIATHGIEFLLFSVAVLFMPYMYIQKAQFTFMQYILEIFFVYYLAKSLVLLIRTKNNYVKENLSDIKDLVKDEKEGYIDEDSSKTLKEQREKEEEEKKKAEKEKKKEEEAKAKEEKLKNTKGKASRKVKKKIKMKERKQ